MGAKGKTEPRFFPPPLRELTSETSAGFEVIEFAKLLGIELYPFQKWALIHGLELLEDGSFRWRVVVIEVARQNGKTMLMVSRPLENLPIWSISRAFCRAIAQRCRRHIERSISNRSVEPRAANIPARQSAK
ncbi:hypothetical protein FRC0429_00282 [Corynebacterium diphtheriae]|nr:hypothetical protein FRC0429_00282 [Corynebacterium diphtheriae]